MSDFFSYRTILLVKHNGMNLDDLHKSIEKVYDTSRKDRKDWNLLYVAEQCSAKSTTVVAYSHDKPLSKSFSHIDILVREALSEITLAHGQKFVDRIVRCNPTCLHNNGRVPLTTKESQIDWMKRRLTEGGFDPESIEVVLRERPYQFTKSNGHKVTLHSVVFKISVVVDNVVKARNLLLKGIGRGAAYGFGLVDITPKSCDRIPHPRGGGPSCDVRRVV